VGGGKMTMSIKNFNLQSSQVRRRGKIGLKQYLIYIHPFTPLSPIFLPTPLQLTSPPKNYTKKKKIMGWQFHPNTVTSMITVSSSSSSIMLLLPLLTTTTITNNK
jgi:hypothetical protein